MGEFVPPDWEFYKEKSGSEKVQDNVEHKTWLTKVCDWISAPDGMLKLMVLSLGLTVIFALLAIWIPLQQLANTGGLFAVLFLLAFSGWFLQKTLG